MNFYDLTNWWANWQAGPPVPSLAEFRASGPPPQRFHTAKVTAVAFSADGTRAFSSSQDGTVKVWRIVPRTSATVITTLS